LEKHVTSNIKIDQVLNITGLQQPQSSFLVSKTLEKVHSGGVLEIISDSKHSRNILRSICPKSRYSILEKKEIRGLFHYTIKKN